MYCWWLSWRIDIYLVRCTVSQTACPKIKTKSERALENLNENWGSEITREKLRTQFARECAGARSIRDNTITLAEKKEQLIRITTSKHSP